MRNTKQIIQNTGKATLKYMHRNIIDNNEIIGTI